MEVRDQHLHAHEGKHGREPVVQEVEFFHHAREQEIQGPKPEDREHVRREHEEWIPRDREDGGDRIQGEQDVGRLDHDEDDKERRRDFPNAALDGLLGEETMPIVVRRNPDEPPDELQNRIPLGLDVGLPLGCHANSRNHQERAEHIDEPLEPLEEQPTGADHRPPQRQRAEDAPEEHAVLIGGRDAKVVEDEDEDEDVVYRECELDQIAGQELKTRLGAALIEDEGVEKRRRDHHHHGPTRGFLERYDVGRAIEDAQVDREHHRDEDAEADPEPDLSHLASLVQPRGCATRVGEIETTLAPGTPRNEGLALTWGSGGPPRSRTTVRRRGNRGPAVLTIGRRLEVGRLLPFWTEAIQRSRASSIGVWAVNLLGKLCTGCFA